MKNRFESQEEQNKQKQENEEFRLFYSGFSPVFGYNKKTDESFIVYIPEAWPSGGAHGLRMIAIRKWIDNKVILGNLHHNDEDYRWTEVDLKTGEMRLVKGNELEE